MIPSKCCLVFCKKIGIGVWNIFKEPHKPPEMGYEFSMDDFHKLESLQCIFDGKGGGLVIGNLHKDGGIYLLQTLPEKKLRYVGEMEGWEYLTAPLKNEGFKSKFEKINNQTIKKGKYINTKFNIPKNCKVIDTSKAKVPFLLIHHNGHYILNRFATKQYIEQIIKLDNENSL